MALVVTVPQLQAVNPGALDRAAHAWQHWADMIETRYGEYSDAAVVPLQKSSWAGDTYAAAMTSLLGLGADFQATSNEIRAVGITMAGLARALKNAKDLLGKGLAAAPAQGVVFKPDGSWTKVVDPAGEAHVSSIPECVELVHTALDEAKNADDYASKEFAGLSRAVQRATSGDTGGARQDLLTAELPPKGTDPAFVRGVWDSLTQDQKTFLINSDPAAVGSLDGIPTPDRDTANRKVLATDETLLDKQIADLKQQIARERDRPIGGDPAYLRELETKLSGLEDRRDGLTEIDKALKRHEPGLPLYLMGLDLNGRGHAIVAVGNPDTADNVSVIVPGVGSGVTGHMHGLIRQAEHVKSAVGGNSAAVMWVGYDAPPTPWDGGSSIGPGSGAQNGAEPFNHFMQGLEATQTGSMPKTTVIGHSYGSDLVTRAAQSGDGFRTDNLILLGSPGVPVRHANDFGVDPTRVFAARSGNDWISLADHYHSNGADPVDPNFGAHVFKVQPGSGDWRTPWDDNNAHGQYFDLNTESLRQIAAIANGGDPVPK